MSQERLRLFFSSFNIVDFVFDLHNIFRSICLSACICFIVYLTYVVKSTPHICMKYEYDVYITSLVCDVFQHYIVNLFPNHS